MGRQKPSLFYSNKMASMIGQCSATNVVAVTNNPPKKANMVLSFNGIIYRVEYPFQNRTRAVFLYGVATSCTEPSLSGAHDCQLLIPIAGRRVRVAACLLLFGIF